MQSTPLTWRSFLVGTTIARADVHLKPSFGESQDLALLTMKQASQLLRRKVASPVELTRACLKRIETYNPALNAFITVTSDQAMEAARVMETEQRRGKWRGPLHGIPIAVKDNIDTVGIRTVPLRSLHSEH